MRNAHLVLPHSARFPRATSTAARLRAALFLLLSLYLSTPTPSSAAEFQFDFDDLLERPAAEPTPSMPPLRTAGVFSRSDAEHLAEAYALAHGRLQLFPSCRALFTPYGTGGEERLATSLYVRATSRHESQICGRRVAAFTAVESPVTRLCRNFRRLGPEKGALILIHEALHFAGMPEAPHEKDAMTSQEINELVAESCGL